MGKNNDNLEKRLASLENLILSLRDQHTAYSYEFILKEYDMTAKALSDNLKSVERVTNHNRYFTAGLLSIIAYILTNIDKSPSIVELFGVTSVKFIIFVLLPFLGIVSCISTIFSLVKYRRRDAWCYSRMNLIRKICLSDEDSKILFRFKEYSNSRYGRITEFKFDAKKVMQHEWRHNARVVEPIIGLWISFIISYFFHGYLLPLLLAVLVLSVLSVANPIYRRMMKNELQ